MPPDPFSDGVKNVAETESELMDSSSIGDRREAGRDMIIL